MIEYFCDIKTSLRMNKKSKHRSSRKTWLYVAVTVVLIAIAGIAMTALRRSDGADRWIRIPRDATKESVRDSLISALGNDGARVYTMWTLMGGQPEKAHGAYKVSGNTLLLKVARRMSRGMQTPIRVGWNEARTMNEFARKVTAALECTPDEFLKCCDSLLHERGYAKSEYIAAFLPDTYEFYWTVAPCELVGRLNDSRNKFWTDERIAKAKAEGLTVTEATTLTSIVMEESSKLDEYGKIGRLYLNRLKADMPLQADPTVKFAIGDPSIKRIVNSMLRTPSAYNTYLNKGLPPGPIRMADKRAIDAVLNAGKHSYLYMCAKEDFSGYHNFAADYAAHLANARRYQKALDTRGIR